MKARAARLARFLTTVFSRTGASGSSTGSADIASSPFHRALDDPRQVLALAVRLLESQQPVEPLKFFRTQHGAQHGARGELRIALREQRRQLDLAEPPLAAFCVAFGLTAEQLGLLCRPEHATPEQLGCYLRAAVDCAANDLTHQPSSMSAKPITARSRFFRRSPSIRYSPLEM